MKSPRTAVKAPPWTMRNAAPSYIALKSQLPAWSAARSRSISAVSPGVRDGFDKVPVQSDIWAMYPSSDRVECPGAVADRQHGHLHESGRSQTCRAILPDTLTYLPPHSVRRLSGGYRKSGWRPPRMVVSPVLAELRRQVFDSEILSFTVAKIRDCPRPSDENRHLYLGWRRRSRPKTAAQGLSGGVLNRSLGA
jgi:hypothetical protein